MRSVIIIFLASLFLLQSAGKLIVIASFELNKDFIVKNLCENKAKPKMRCNGKCHLKKQLQKEEKRENSNTSVKEKSEIQFFSEVNFSFRSPGYEVKQELSTIYLLTSYSKHLLSVFHPPQA